MKRSKFTDEQILAIVKRRRGRPEGRRSVPHARHHRADVLPLEGEVRRDGAQRDAAAEAARGREPPAEADRRRADARHPGAEGGGRKKVVSPIAGATRWGGCSDARHESATRLSRLGLSTATWRYQRRGQRDQRRVAGAAAGACGGPRAVWLSAAAHAGGARAWSSTTSGSIASIARPGCRSADGGGSG